MDDQRILMVDDVIQTDNTELGEHVLCKYQYSNHLGSVALELDETAQIISCEELHPYGTTAYQLVGRGTRATAKRYRYTGMERDEETGLSYHTARYFIPWLGKWTSADKTSFDDGLNLYCMSRNDPVNRVDRGGGQSRRDFDTLSSIDPERIRARALEIAAADLPSYPVDPHNSQGNLLPASFSSVWDGRTSGVLALLHNPDNAQFSYSRLLEVGSTPGGSAYFDSYLTISVAARESGGRSFTPSADRTLYHTYYSGGLDNLGQAMATGRLTEFNAPAAYLARWQRHASDPLATAISIRTGRTHPLIGLNERGTERHSAGLRLTDFLVGYGSYLNAQWDDQRRGTAEGSLSFLGTIESYGFTQADAGGLSSLAGRIWHALFFGGPGGVNFREEGHFGARTILSFLQAGGYGLEDITRIAELLGGESIVSERRTRSAFTVALIAEAMEREVTAVEDAEDADWQVFVDELNRDFPSP